MGKKRGVQAYKCQKCAYRFTNKKRKTQKSFEIYKSYSLRKQTYKELKAQYGKSSKTFRKHFDSLLDGSIASFPFINKPVNVVFDATFFGRGYGVLVFRANGKNIYWEEIISESMNTISRALEVLDEICIGGIQKFYNRWS